MFTRQWAATASSRLKPSLPVAWSSTPWIVSSSVGFLNAGVSADPLGVRFRSGGKSKSRKKHAEKHQARPSNLMRGKSSDRTGLSMPQKRRQQQTTSGKFEEHILQTFYRLVGSWEDFKKYCDSEEIFEQDRANFSLQLKRTVSRESLRGYTNLRHLANPTEVIQLRELRRVFIDSDQRGLEAYLMNHFHTFLLRRRHSAVIAAKQAQLANISYPWEWFPATRAMQRTIHLHVGPTNSGKTYHALKALEAAKTGVYCGPLRLLAHEIYTRFEAKNKPCALITGEEQRIPPNVDQYYISCTVEMAPLSSRFDVAVIDEIQMIADPDRGFAWTQAFLGVQAKEVHLCGEERTVDLIKSLCATIGDKCVVHNYQRLTPLQAGKKALSDYSRLEKGDCVVAFSRLNLHNLKSKIESETGRKCAIVYGGLPPEVRAQQAALFNDPDNDYDYLVASDAIGMGLNLEIKRVIFDTLVKFNGTSQQLLGISDMRQIGGRAGRYRTARQEMAKEGPTPQSENVGIVTTLDPVDLPLVKEYLWKDPEPIEQAAIFPPMATLEQFSTYFEPGTSFHYILYRFIQLHTRSPRFQFSMKGDMLRVAKEIDEFPLSVHDRCVLLTAPSSIRMPGVVPVLKSIAQCLAGNESGHILDLPGFPIDKYDLETDKPLDRLQNLEFLHHAVTLYLWVSYRFPHIFVSQALAFHLRDLVQQKITRSLETLTFSNEEMNRRRQRNRQYVMKNEQRLVQILGDAFGFDDGKLKTLREKEDESTPAYVENSEDLGDLAESETSSDKPTDEPTPSPSDSSALPPTNSKPSSSSKPKEKSKPFEKKSKPSKKKKKNQQRQP